MLRAKQVDELGGKGGCGRVGVSLYPLYHPHPQATLLRRKIRFLVTPRWLGGEHRGNCQNERASERIQCPLDQCRDDNEEAMPVVRLTRQMGGSKSH